MTRFVAVLSQELRLSLRHGADTLAALLFFLLAASLFPLAIGPAPETLGRIAPGIVWVCSLLAALLPLDRLFGGPGISKIRFRLPDHNLAIPKPR
jgi:heme exporter protein B